MKEADFNYDQLIHSESFRRWVQGSASQEEKSCWDQWIMKSSENRAVAMRAQQHILGFSIRPSSQPAQDKAWDRLQHRTVTGSKKHVAGRTRTGFERIYRFAAIFLLTALTGLAVSLIVGDKANENLQGQVVRNEIVTDYGERKTISLSDGSEIILNAHSNLVYTTDRSDSNAVEVFLDGEAHFSVAKREKPTNTAFKVKTSSGLVKVMGTQFVVSTRNLNTQVVLEEGRVALTPANQVKETILKPGQLAAFNSDSDTIHTRLVNPKVYTSWTSYALVFDKTPFRDVVARLENTYGVKVVVREPDLYERKISGSVDNSSLDVITSALSNTLDTQVKVTDTAVYIGRNSSSVD